MRNVLYLRFALYKYRHAVAMLLFLELCYLLCRFKKKDLAWTKLPNIAQLFFPNKLQGTPFIYVGV